MATISEQEVLHVAQLARLTLTDEEVAALRNDLGAILRHVQQLDEVVTDNVAAEPCVGPSLAPLVADEVQVGLTQGQALAGAPRTSRGGFAVPAFVDD